MNLAILGTGNMGRAIIGGLKKACADNARIAVWDKMPAALEGLDGDADLIEPCNWSTSGFIPDAVIISVKPADVLELLGAVALIIREQKLNFLTISVAAGVTIASIREKIGGSARVCRVMPNTPALIGEGLSAYSLSDNCTPEDARLVERIFGACGEVLSVPESLMDAVTGLSGSGPAFVYSFIEALAEGGVSAGLPYAAALDAAVQTVIGAARMVRITSEHPSVLRSKVMSPGGTTVKGLQALERGAFKNAVMSAVTEAAAQSAKMGS
jgi:pyrroline-5-carboxylate reductase